MTAAEIAEAILRHNGPPDAPGWSRADGGSFVPRDVLRSRLLQLPHRLLAAMLRGLAAAEARRDVERNWAGMRDRPVVHCVVRETALEGHGTFREVVEVLPDHEAASARTVELALANKQENVGYVASAIPVRTGGEEG